MTELEKWCYDLCADAKTTWDSLDSCFFMGINFQKVQIKNAYFMKAGKHMVQK